MDRARKENKFSKYLINGRINCMSRASTAVFPKVRRVLAELGENVRLARKRRGLSATLTAERAGLSRPTLRAIERGDPGITLGSLANVLHSLGLEADIGTVGRADPVGRQLQDAALSSGNRPSRHIPPKGSGLLRFGRSTAVGAARARKPARSPQEAR